MLEYYLHYCKMNVFMTPVIWQLSRTYKIGMGTKTGFLVAEKTIKNYQR